MCVNAHAAEHGWRSEDNMLELGLSLYHMGPRDGTRVIRLGKQVPWLAEPSLALNMPLRFKILWGSLSIFFFCIVYLGYNFLLTPSPRGALRLLFLLSAMLNSTCSDDRIISSSCCCGTHFPKCTAFPRQTSLLCWNGWALSGYPWVKVSPKLEDRYHQGYSVTWRLTLREALPNSLVWLLDTREDPFPNMQVLRILPNARWWWERAPRQGPQAFYTHVRAATSELLRFPLWSESPSSLHGRDLRAMVQAAQQCPKMELVGHTESPLNSMCSELSSLWRVCHFTFSPE